MFVQLFPTQFCQRVGFKRDFNIVGSANGQSCDVVDGVLCTGDLRVLGVLTRATAGFSET